LQQLELGTACIDLQKPVVAGSYQTITFTYTAGHPIDDSGYLKITFRFAGDFGIPQFDDPAVPNCRRVYTTGDCHIQPRWDPKGHTRPWGRAIYLKVPGRFLNTGEQMVVVFGDRTAPVTARPAELPCNGRRCRALLILTKETLPTR